MRHIISILLQNEAGALSRVANMFSTRGYNIESLNVAPTADETVSRLTLVTTGSETVIDQIEKQLGKLVDVVEIADMTKTDHIERELALFKVHMNGSAAKLTAVLEQFGARLLSDRFLKRLASVSASVAIVRSGAMAVARGAAATKRA
jgi:acetolactate synthase-1/3 small subunit